MDGAEVSICIGAQRFGKFGVSEQWPWFSYLPCGSWYGSWDVDFCGAVPLIPQSTSAQVTSALGAIELMELQGQLKCFAGLRSVQPAPVLWARETCSECSEWGELAELSLKGEYEPSLYSVYGQSPDATVNCFWGEAGNWLKTCAKYSVHPWLGL